MVEWKTLGNICEIGTGSNNREDACENGLYPFFVRSQDVLRIDSYLFDEEAILIPGEGGIGDIFHYVNGKYGLHQRTYRVHPISDSIKGRYIYYYLFANFKSYINQKSYKATAASIRKPMLTDFPIAIPSLSEQQRIVGILDTFTSSIENLKEQIAQRRKQYEYYRDELLDLEGKEGVEMKTLGEVLQVKKGEYITKKEAKEGIYPVILGGKEPAYYINKYNHIGKAIVISRSGASAGYVSFWNEPIFVTDGFLIEPKGDVVYEFLFYVLKSKQRELHGAQKGGAILHVTPALIGAISVFMPDVITQQRIVSILDTFEASISNLEEQLKEREKQYEYYRNKLLTFE